MIDCAVIKIVHNNSMFGSRPITKTDKIMKYKDKYTCMYCNNMCKCNNYNIITIVRMSCRTK